MIYLENQPLKVYINANNTTEIIIVQNILESYEKYIMAVEKNVMTLYSKMEEDKLSQDIIEKANYEISLDLVMTALSRGNFFDFHEIKDSKSIGIFNYYCYVAISLLITYLTIFSGIKLMMERNSGILSRYLVSGNSMRLFLFSKVIVQLIFVSLVTIINLFLLHGYITESVFASLQLYLLIISFYFWFIGLFFLISSVVKTRQNYLLMSNALALVMLIIGGGIIPIKYMPDNLVTLSRLTPVYWFMKGIIAIQNNADTGNVTGILAVFTIVGIGLFLFTAEFCQKAGAIYE
jgi:ABC-2 type transport system permease protein